MAASLLFFCLALLLPTTIARASTPLTNSAAATEGSPEWMDQMLAQHNLNRVIRLGIKYMDGDGVPADPKRGIQLFARAAVAGNLDAKRFIGIAHLKGAGVAKDSTKAIDWLEAAARDGDPHAQEQLGTLYAAGTDVPINNAKARAWFTLAATQNLAEAQADLGVMYWDGIGVKADLVEAYKWIELATEAKYVGASQARDKIEPQLTPAQKQEALRRAKAFTPNPDAPMVPDDFGPVACPMDAQYRISVVIQGKTNFLRVDTGSSLTCLDSTFCKKLGDPLTSQSASTLAPDSVKVNCWECPEFFICGHRSAPLLVAADNFQITGVLSGHHLDGVLGMFCLQYHVLCFNPDKNTFTLGGAVPDAVKKTALALPLKVTLGDVCAVSATINGHGPILLQIDSGFDESVSLNQTDWQIAMPQKTNTLTAKGSVGFGATPEINFQTRLQTLTLGTNIYTGLTAESQSNPNAPSRLGLRFLRRHLCYLDFPNNTLYLLPAKNFSQSDPQQQSLH